MKSLSIAFQTNKPINAYGALAAQVEAYGFGGVTAYNDMLYQPAWLPLLEMARATRRVRLGPAAVNPFTCHPLNIAGNVALLDEASQGRAYPGIARGAWLDFLGLDPPKPVTAVRDAIRAIQHLLSQSTDPFTSNFFPLAGGDTLRWSITRPTIPILLGTWGPGLMAACAGLMQEVKLGGTANPDIVPWVRRQLARHTPQASIVVGAVTVVDEDGAAARQLARREVALYLPVVAHLDPTITLEPDILTGLEDTTSRYDFDGAARFISDELLAKFAFAGTPAEVVDQAHALFAAGASRVEFGTPHGVSTAKGLELLGTAVLPALKEYLN